MRVAIFLMFLGFGIVCQGQQNSEKKMTIPEYIETFHRDAINNMIKFKIPASITLAQGILESGVGNSPLAKEANNHFGIKCHKGWEGETYTYDDDEKGECFRKYKSVYDSYADHANFLISRPRYSALFELEITDYKGWARELKKAGYATAPDYAEKLISLIERFDLQNFDIIINDSNAQNEPEIKTVQASTPKDLEKTREIEKPKDSERKREQKEHKQDTPKEKETILAKEEKEIVRPQTESALNNDSEYSWRKPNKVEIKEAGKGKIIPQEEIDIWGSRTEQTNNDVKYVIAGKNDTKQKIADHFQMNIFLINKFNEFAKNHEIKEGDIVYLQPKRNKSKYIDTHVVRQGDTLFSISQTYGVKTKSLLQLNDISADAELKPGDTIKLK